MKEFNHVVGSTELCAWQPRSGIVWVQTRSPEYARLLAKQKGSRQVGVGVAGGYLRIFELRHSLKWARNLVARYARRQMSANSGIKVLKAPTRD